MKPVRLLGFVVVLMGVFFAVFADDAAPYPQYVFVKKHLSTVYLSNTDPKPDQIIRQVRKGEYIELLSEGDSWYKVRVDGRDGYLEARNGKVVNKKGAPEVMLLLFIVLFLCLTLGVVLYIMKQRSSPAAAKDHDLDDLDDDLDDLDED